MTKRELLPDMRHGLTRRFTIPYTRDDGTPDKLKIYITANTYPDGRLGEVFIKADAGGDVRGTGSEPRGVYSFLKGSLDAWAIMLSVGLQHGVPLATYTAKIRNMRFEPAGFTGDKDFHSCTSPLDLVAQWLDSTFQREPAP